MFLAVKIPNTHHDTESRKMLTMEKTLTYEQALAWWETKTDDQKFRAVGIEVIDKWVRQVIEDEFLEKPAPISAISVIKSLSK
jgi:hypothetical protein